MIITSAGVSEIVKSSLDLLLDQVDPQYEIDRDLIHVIANEPDYIHESELIKGFKQPLVHTTNKDEIVKRHFEEDFTFQKLGGKTNLIVLGDLVDDMTMINRIKSSELNSLYVGFYNNP